MIGAGDFGRVFGRAAAICLLLNLGVNFTDAATRSEPSAMQLTSSAFSESQEIPAQYTCDGQNVSPPLKWSGAPAETKSFTLIVDDPDAPVGTWTHWVLFDLPAATTELPEALPKGQYVAAGARQGLNDFKHLGYGGPCPPAGKPHRYFFKVYALDHLLDLKPGASKKEVESALDKHTLAQGQLIGLYKRK